MNKLTKRLQLSRRSVLRGAGGAVLSLPFLEAMTATPAYAQAGQPLRYVVMTSGQPAGKDNVSTNFFVPDQTGSLANQTLKAGLSELSDLRSDFTIVSGLQIPSQGLDGYSSTPAGGKPPATHDNTVSPLLSGKSNNAANGQYSPRGVTSDFLIAQQFGNVTPFSQLTYRVQLDEINGHFAEISYRNATTPVNNSIADPRVAWQALFGNFSAPSAGGGAPTAEQIATERKKRRGRSVIDAVLQSSQSLNDKLSTIDRARMSDHFDRLREIEVRLAALPQEPSTAACSKPAQPGGFATGGDYNDEIPRGELLVDLISMAFACDLTRVATVLISFSMPMFTLPGHNLDVHEESHSGGTDPFVVSQSWHHGLFARLMRSLKALPEGNGTVLDNSLIVFALEAGHGRNAEAGGADLQAHSTDNMHLLLGGGAGGAIKRGQHIRPATSGTHPNGSPKPRHPASVLVSCMQAMGVETNALGDVTGAVTEVLT